MHLIRLDCSTSWVENKIIDTVNLLRSEIFPKPSLNCEYCNYLKNDGSYQLLNTKEKIHCYFWKNSQ